MGNGRDLLDRARKVADELRGHKRAARIAREGAQAAAAELAKIKAECDRLGIAFTVLPDRCPGRIDG
jgi:Xaa-Pro aminopeptidase